MLYTWGISGSCPQKSFVNETELSIIQSWGCLPFTASCNMKTKLQSVSKTLKEVTLVELDFLSSIPLGRSVFGVCSGASWVCCWQSAVDFLGSGLFYYCSTSRADVTCAESSVPFCSESTRSSMGENHSVLLGANHHSSLCFQSLMIFINTEGAGIANSLLLKGKVPEMKLKLL